MKILKKLFCISCLCLFSLFAFSQERELSDYEKYRLEKEATPDTIREIDTLIINNTYYIDQYPDYRSRVYFSHYPFYWDDPYYAYPLYYNIYTYYTPSVVVPQTRREIRKERRVVRSSYSTPVRSVQPRTYNPQPARRQSSYRSAPTRTYTPTQRHSAPMRHSSPARGSSGGRRR